MTVKKKVDDKILILALQGELDMYNATDFRNEVEKLLETYHPEGILLNFRNLKYVDSSGIGILLSLLKKTNKMNVSTCFCYIQNQVLEVIKLTRILPLFEIRGSEKKAYDFLKEQIVEKNVTTEFPISINENSPLMNKEGMEHKTINLEYKRIRYMSHLITQDAPKNIKEFNLLEQQVSEIIKNGVRHGNRNDINKELKIWWYFDESSARLIVEDEGEGFQNLEDWLEFYRRRMECFKASDFENMTDYLSYRTENSTEDDGGNALFAAVEYWNRGVVLNRKKNAIAVARHF